MNAMRKRAGVPLPSAIEARGDAESHHCGDRCEARGAEMFFVEEPHALMHRSDLPVRLRMRAALAFEMRDDAAGVVPDLPPRFRRPDTPVDVFAEAEHLFV